MPSLRPSRRGAVDPFLVMEVLEAANERAAAGADVIHLEVGEPGGGAPTVVIEAAKRALDTEPMGYIEAMGLPALRERIAVHYAETYGVSVPVSRIMITAGASAAFVLAFIAAFDAGARIAMADPGYPAYRNILKGLDLCPVPIAAAPEDGFQPTPGSLSPLGPVAGLILASPANPTGTMLGPQALAALARHCSQSQIRIISDEIYHGIEFEEPARTMLEFAPDAIVINSFSKYFAMTGWRLGWMIVPQELVEPVKRLGQNLFISPSAIAQNAALAAFDAKDELSARVETYERNRARLLAALEAGGVTDKAPSDGAFYIYARTSGFSNDSVELARRILAETGVAATPGIDFDPRRGHHFMRFSFACDEAAIDKAANRLEAWFKAAHRL